MDIRVALIEDKDDAIIDVLMIRDDCNRIDYVESEDSNGPKPAL